MRNPYCRGILRFEGGLNDILLLYCCRIGEFIGNGCYILYIRDLLLLFEFLIVISYFLADIMGCTESGSLNRVVCRNTVADGEEEF